MNADVVGNNAGFARLAFAYGEHFIGRVLLIFNLQIKRLLILQLNYKINLYIARFENSQKRSSLKIKARKLITLDMDNIDRKQ